jgi:GNAT superfamily N-acetyltransferase
MDIAITPLDGADEAAAHEAIAVLSAAQAVDLPDFPPVCPQRFLGNLRVPWPGQRTEHALARVDGRAVGYANVGLPIVDNLENSDVDITVHPDHRGRGVGRRLFEHAVAVARHNGRKRMLAMVPEAFSGRPPLGVAGNAFAASVGAKSALIEVRRRLDVGSIDADAQAILLRDGYAKADGYSIVRWEGPVSGEYIDDIAYLDGRLLQDAPLGEVEWEPEQHDAVRVRAADAARQARGLRTYHTAARHDASGHLVAWTAIGFEATSPWHAWQQITIVEPKHRGHRLGAIVKIENLRHVQAHEPALTTVDTWNAAVNDHMISINEAMGFRTAEQWHNYQLTL